jgi:hypothetical protein
MPDIAILTPTNSAWSSSTFREAVAASVDSTILRIPIGMRPTVAIAVADATGRAVEYTTSPDAMVSAGTALWRTWDNGVVTNATAEAGTTDSLVGPVTALRLSNAGGKNGAVTWEVAA